MNHNFVHDIICVRIGLYNVNLMEIGNILIAQSYFMQAISFKLFCGLHVVASRWSNAQITCYL